IDRWWEAANGTAYAEWLPNGQDVGFVTRLGDVENGEWFKHEILDRKAGKFRVSSNGPKASGGIDLAAVSSMCRLVAYGDSKRKLLLWQPSDGNFRIRSFDMMPPFAVGSFSPDGRYLAVGDQAGVVSILRLSERGQVPVIAPAAPDKEAPPATERILP